MFRNAPGRLWQNPVNIAWLLVGDLGTGAVGSLPSALTVCQNQVFDGVQTAFIVRGHGHHARNAVCGGPAKRFWHNTSRRL